MMEVVINTKKSTLPFTRLDTGTCFMLDGMLWVKVYADNTYCAQRIGGPACVSVNPNRECLLVSKIEATAV